MSRRAVLGSSACTVALPFLESLAPKTASAAVSAEPRRLMWVHIHNGMSRRLLTPAQAGPSYTLPPWLEPLAEDDLRDEITVLSGLSNSVGDPAGEVAVHPADSASFLTGVVPGDGDVPTAGISVDQVAANALGKFTPIAPSLVLDTNTKQCGDGKHGCVYYSNISWLDDTTPAPLEDSPAAVFDRLFGGFDPGATAAELARRKHYRQSVLDHVQVDVERVRTKLGAADEARLEQYLDSVRDLELILDAEQLSCDPGSAPPGYDDFQQQVEQMYDVIALAFQCDATRVVSLMLNKHSGQFDFVTPAATQGHHTLSHGASANERAQYEAITQWQVASLASLTRKLRDALDAEGQSVLDNSLVLFGAGHDSTGHQPGDASMEFVGGNVHRRTDLPLFLAGRGGGAVVPGHHRVYDDAPPVADLHLAMLHSAGIELDSFGRDGTQPLPGLADV
ncbi:MAG: DUF1552 domain-containing protein [Myxococcota bacterium]